MKNLKSFTEMRKLLFLCFLFGILGFPQMTMCGTIKTKNEKSRDHDLLGAKIQTDQSKLNLIQKEPIKIEKREVSKSDNDVADITDEDDKKSYEGNEQVAPLVGLNNPTYKDKRHFSSLLKYRSFPIYYHNTFSREGKNYNTYLEDAQDDSVKEIAKRYIGSILKSQTVPHTFIAYPHKKHLSSLLKSRNYSPLFKRNFPEPMIDDGYLDDEYDDDLNAMNYENGEINKRHIGSLRGNRFSLDRKYPYYNYYKRFYGSLLKSPSYVSKTNYDKRYSIPSDYDEIVEYEVDDIIPEEVDDRELVPESEKRHFSSIIDKKHVSSLLKNKGRRLYKREIKESDKTDDEKFLKALNVTDTHQGKVKQQQSRVTKRDLEDQSFGSNLQPSKLYKGQLSSLENIEEKRHISSLFQNKDGKRHLSSLLQNSGFKEDKRNLASLLDDRNTRHLSTLIQNKPKAEDNEFYSDILDSGYDKRYLASLLQNKDLLDKRHFSSVLDDNADKRHLSSLWQNKGYDIEKKHFASLLDSPENKYLRSLLADDGNIEKRHFSSLMDKKYIGSLIDKRHFASILDNSDNKRHFSSLLDNSNDKRHFSSLLDNSDGKRYFGSLLDNSNDKRYFGSLLDNSDDKRYFGSLLDNSDDKRHFSSLLDNSDNKRHFSSLLDNANDKRHFGSPLDNSNDKRHFSSLLDNSDDKRHFGSLLDSPENKRHFASLLDNNRGIDERYLVSLLANSGNDEKRHFATVLDTIGDDKRHFASLLDSKDNIDKKHLASLLDNQYMKRHFSSLLDNQNFMDKKHFSSLIDNKGSAEESNLMSLLHRNTNADKRYFPSVLDNNGNEEKQHYSSSLLDSMNNNDKLYLSSILDNSGVTDRRQFASLLDKEKDAGKNHFSSLQNKEAMDELHLSSLLQNKVGGVYRNPFDFPLDSTKTNFYLNTISTPLNNNEGTDRLYLHSVKDKNFGKWLYQNEIPSHWNVVNSLLSQDYLGNKYLPSLPGGDNKGDNQSMLNNKHLIREYILASILAREGFANNNDINYSYSDSLGKNGAKAKQNYLSSNFPFPGKEIDQLFKNLNNNELERHNQYNTNSNESLPDKRYFASLIKNLRNSSSLEENPTLKVILEKQLPKINPLVGVKPEQKNQKRFFKTLLRDEIDLEKRAAAFLQNEKNEKTSSLVGKESKDGAEKRHIGSLINYKRNDVEEENLILGALMNMERAKVSNGTVLNTNSYSKGDEGRPVEEQKIESDKKFIQSSYKNPTEQSTDDTKNKQNKTRRKRESDNPFVAQDNEIIDNNLPYEELNNQRLKRYIGALAKNNNLPLKANNDQRRLFNIDSNGKPYLRRPSNAASQLEDYLKGQMVRNVIETPGRNRGNLQVVSLEPQLGRNPSLDNVLPGTNIDYSDYGIENDSQASSEENEQNTFSKIDSNDFATYNNDEVFGTRPKRFLGSLARRMWFPRPYRSFVEPRSNSRSSPIDPHHLSGFQSRVMSSSPISPSYPYHQMYRYQVPNLD